ncbi:MAG: pyridoxal-phosphate dependent enzyme [Bacteroidia bacterium]|nr:MAG: pyridoxal-phosphate dependent enzyme [Bacteroidia bacterium]
MDNSHHGFPGKNKIADVREIIASQVHRTPALTCASLNEITGSFLFFKCENFQKGGAFKFRGASHAVITLSREDAVRGVATHSSGNHAQALALAASMRGIKAHIVMPENAPKIKVAAVESYGGIIRFCRPTLPDRESTLLEVIEECGATEIHPYNDYRIIAGQASAAAELYEDTPLLDCLVVPVGGGGLLSGSILSTRYFSPGTKVFGAEPEQANDAWESFQKQKLIPVRNPNTIADGLRTSLGSLTFPIIMEGAEDILTVSEDAIIRAMQLIWERMKIVVEPSAATVLAAVIEHPLHFAGKNTGLILSGGNVDLYRLPWLDRTITNH